MFTFRSSSGNCIWFEINKQLIFKYRRSSGGRICCLKSHNYPCERVPFKCSASTLPTVSSVVALREQCNESLRLRRSADFWSNQVLCLPRRAEIFLLVSGLPALHVPCTHGQTRKYIHLSLTTKSAAKQIVPQHHLHASFNCLC